MAADTQNIFEAAAAGDAAAVIEQARSAAGAQVSTLGHEPVLVVHDLNVEHTLLDPERHNPEPHRAVGTMQLHRPESFVAWTVRHASDATTVWLDLEHRAVVAVVNDHGPYETPGWGDLRGELRLSHHPSWARWVPLSGRWMSRDEFAEHIHLYRQDVADPAAADLLDLIQDLRVSKQIQFRDARRLDNGQEALTYVEEVDGKAGKTGQIPIPTGLVLDLAVFDGQDPEPVPADFQYKLAGGVLACRFVVQQADDRVRAAFETQVAEIADGLADGPATILWGAAPAGGRCSTVA